MSTILKALRRLEDQKTAGAPRPLRDEVVLAGRRPRRRLRLGAAAGITVLIVAVLVGLWWVEFERGRGADDAAASASVPLAEIAPAQDDAPTRISVAAAPQAAGFDRRHEALPVPEPPPDFQVVRPDGSRAPVRPPPLPSVAEEAPAPVAAQPRLAPVPVVPRYQDEVPAHEADAVLYEDDVYSEEDDWVAEEVAPAVPVARAAVGVRVERTEWHPTPGLRVAWVEVDGATALREVREGERVGPYVVRAIEPAAVLFADGSVQVRREVGQ